MKSNIHQKTKQITPGGIDFNPDRMNLETRGSGGQSIKFHIDAAMLKQLQNSTGFVPDVISIQPMTNLRAWFDFKENISSTVS